MDLMKQIVLYTANIAQTYIGTTPQIGEDHAELDEVEENSGKA